MSNYTQRQETIDALASMVIEQADRHGFKIEIDAIRDAVEQMAKFAGIEANETEFMLASQKVEDEARLMGKLSEKSGEMVNNTGKRDHQYSIRIHGVELMRGDTRSLADVFNNLEGRNFEPTGPKEQGREQWLASMSAELKTSLTFGERIVMATPEDHVLRDSLVGRSIPVDGRPEPEQVHRPRC